MAVLLLKKSESLEFIFDEIGYGETSAAGVIDSGQTPMPFVGVQGFKNITYTHQALFFDAFPERLKQVEGNFFYPRKEGLRIRQLWIRDRGDERRREDKREAGAWGEYEEFNLDRLQVYWVYLKRVEGICTSSAPEKITYTLHFTQAFASVPRAVLSI